MKASTFGSAARRCISAPLMWRSCPRATLRAVATQTGPANVTSLRLERALTLARDIVVTVKSWNSRQQAAFTQTARSAPAAAAPARSVRARS